MPSRIVVKIGSSSLTSDEGGLNLEAINFFAGELAALREAGHEVLLVTSGAVAAGFRKIGYPIRPRLLHDKGQPFIALWLHNASSFHFCHYQLY